MLAAEQPRAEYNGSPQTEDGFTRIANELLEAIILSRFSGRQINIIFAIIRCTYGFNKKQDAVSSWQLAKMTNIDRSHVSKTINELVKLNVIKRLPSGRHSHGRFVNDLAINKYYEQWATVAETATVAKIAPLPNHGATVAVLAPVTVAVLATEPLLKQPTLKDNTKDNKDISKEIYFSEVSEDVMKEWLAVRKMKKAAGISKTIYNRMVKESEKAGITLQQAIEHCVFKSWISFEAEWYLKKSESKPNFQNKSKMDISQYDHSDTGSKF
jgi:phage replication O-like protein O